MLNRILASIVLFLCETIVYGTSAVIECVYHVLHVWARLTNNPALASAAIEGLHETAEINDEYAKKLEQSGKGDNDKVQSDT